MRFSKKLDGAPVSTEEKAALTKRLANLHDIKHIFQGLAEYEKLHRGSVLMVTILELIKEHEQELGL